MASSHIHQWRGCAQQEASSYSEDNDSAESRPTRAQCLRICPGHAYRKRLELVGQAVWLILSTVKAHLAKLLRWAYVGLVGFCSAYLAMHLVRQTDWYKDRIYQQLLAGTPRQQFRAASTLARLGSETHLLAALKVEAPTVHELARRALEYLWFNAAGEEAFEMIQAAHKAGEKDNLQEALAILDRLVTKFPKYAEGWNRRAAIYWQIGRYEQSLRDCERALVLNAHHYGAWQGIGICYLQMGDLAVACRSLRAALRIAPHDESAQRCLRRCEALLRIYPHPLKQRKTMDLI